METFRVQGLVSGINSQDIIDAMIEVDRGATRVLEGRKTTIEARLEAVRGLNTRLLSAQLDLSELKRAPTFAGRTATVSDEAVLSATVNSSAAPGTYSFQVLGRATAEQRTTAVQASATASIGSGSLTVQIGSGISTEIALTSANNSLTGIAKAINDAKVGVVASVVLEGGGHRLILQSQQTGGDNAISLSASDVSGTALADLVGGMTIIQAAADAQLQLGSGPQALTISYASNTVSDFIPGVTLNLTKASTGPVTVTVGTDTTAATEAITSFVDSFNEAHRYLKANSSYDPVTRQGGILISESGLKAAIGRVMSAAMGADNALPSSMNTLAALGVSIDRSSGELVLDTAKLNAKLAEDPSAIGTLFRNTGTSTAPGAEFAFLGTATVPGTYAVVVTQAATQAQVGTTGDITDDGGGNVVIGAGNKALSLTINNRNITATLAEGTYTRAALAEQLQVAINAHLPSGSQVTVGLDGDALDLRSRGYGANQLMKVTGGTANAVLNLQTTQATGGNVQGTIGGVAATGAGQVLTAGAGTPAQGMALLVSSGSPMSTTVTVRKGLAQRIEDTLRSMTQTETGSVVQKEDQLKRSAADMSTRITALDARLEQRRSRYASQFLAMEKLIASFRSMETALQGQISGFENMSRARSGG